MGLPGSRRGKVILGAGVVTVLVVGVVAFGAWYKLFREVDQDFTDPSEQFAYGSIGSESAEGIPFEIWRVLPEIFPQHLPGPGGYLSLGMYREKGREMPVGFTKKTVGIPRVAFNCAACHSATFRTDRAGARKLVLTAPATSFDPQGYVRFLIAAGSDKRFTADNILEAIARHTKLSWIDKQLYRHVIIPRTRDALREQARRFAWTNLRPDWGPGRIDPFNPVKFHHLEFDPREDHSIGNSDMEPLWNMAPKAGFALHWDGLNDSLTEVVLTGAIGDGATSVTGEPTDKLPVDDLKRIEDYIKKVKAPEYPFAVDRRLAARGEAVFADKCASCHEFGGARTGKVIPLPEIKTDRHRLDHWTQAAVDKYNAYADGFDFDFEHFRKTNGYTAVAMDGLWLRAPYLHNGSVPSVEDLLKPARARPKTFYRGYDVVHPRKLGFISQGPSARREGWLYDTRVAGNSNQGHEGSAYGTTLPQADKRSLVEYLKTR
ncbi:MAG TPA: c-type cytochrome [Solirubrobacteraceae bacterium]|nr:c-type cytochrome [Solirubrobacteraceae bacterium]